MNEVRLYLLLFITLLVPEAYFQNSSITTNKTKIGLLLADLSIERWAKDRDFFLLSAKEQGYDVLVANADGNQNKQIEQANEMIKAGVKAIVVVPVDAYISAPIVEIAHKYGVKVMAYDRIIMNCDLDAYISYDNEMVGEIAAIYITMKVKQGKFFHIGGPRSDRNSFYIHQGIMKIMKPFIENKSFVMLCDTFTNNWTEPEAYKIFKEYFEVGKSLPNVVFADNDQLATGVIKVLEEKGLAGKVMVTGQDADLIACRNIVSGKQTITIFKPIRTLADRAVLLTAGLLGDIPFNTISAVFNGKVDVPSFLLNPVPVIKNNLKTTVIMENFHSRAEIYKKSHN